MENSLITIIDDFLSNDELKSLQDLMIYGINWYYNDFVDYNPKDADAIKVDDYLHNFQFTHAFFKNCVPVSDHLKSLNPILKKLNIASIVRIKANLSTVSNTIERHNFHEDFSDITCTTAIFYVNTNNGVTIFEDGTTVNSVENRLVRFNSKLKHTGTTCTDKKIRCVINFNYFETDR